MRCETCQGTGTIMCMAPAQGNSPLCQTTTTKCSECNGFGFFPEEPTQFEDATPVESIDSQETEKSSRRRTNELQKPAQATTLKK